MGVRQSPGTRDPHLFTLLLSVLLTADAAFFPDARMSNEGYIWTPSKSHPPLEAGSLCRDKESPFPRQGWHEPAPSLCTVHGPCPCDRAPSVPAKPATSCHHSCPRTAKHSKGPTSVSPSGPDSHEYEARVGPRVSSSRFPPDSAFLL